MDEKLKTKNRRYSMLIEWKNFFFVFFPFLGSLPMAYIQAKGQKGAVAAGLQHSHSNARSELHLQPTPQLMAMLDPEPTEQGQGWNPQPHSS